MTQDLSAVILTKNESKNISECLSSLKFCQDILVIDDFSKDDTKEISQKHKARVFKRKLNNDFASQRNFGLAKAKNEWVLFIDADERVSTKLVKEIEQKINTHKYNGFYIRRKDTWLGKKLNHSEWGNIKLLRLGRISKGKWSRSIHETWKIRGKIGVLDNYIDHYPHQNIFKTIDHISFHSGLHADENRKEGKNINIIGVIFYPIAKFSKDYFFDLGFLDGTHGFVLSTLMSFHSFLAWSGLWLKKR
jgi:glycosyltransferase involved in cell wall biosynthesis